MSKLIQSLKQAGYGDRLFTEQTLARIVGGSDGRRYGLVNRALRDGSLTRVKRGLYTLGDAYQRDVPHPYCVAQALAPGSYISMESALSFHGWIPEAVYATTSISTGRKTLIRDTQRFGHFSFHPVAVNKYHFLVSVDRKTFGKLSVLIAQPLRALMDLVAHRKVSWGDMGWLETGLRIDRETLAGLRRSDFAALYPVYKHRQVHSFLTALEAEVAALIASSDKGSRHA